MTVPGSAPRQGSIRLPGLPQARPRKWPWPVLPQRAAAPTEGPLPAAPLAMLAPPPQNPPRRQTSRVRAVRRARRTACARLTFGRTRRGAHGRDDGLWRVAAAAAEPPKKFKPPVGGMNLLAAVGPGGFPAYGVGLVANERRRREMLTRATTVATVLRGLRVDKCSRLRKTGGAAGGSSSSSSASEPTK